MKIKMLLFFMFLSAATAPCADFCVYEANYPQVKDYNVNVEQATLTINPRGAFIEMNLEMTVSYDFKSWFFKNYNELEFLWEFALPDQAGIVDFQIWWEDSLRQATMLDRWTAELLFSEVSSPVRHPALLTQSFPDREGQVHYNLRLYPIMRNEKRMFKIQYLMPARPTNETLRIWLPISQLTSRKSPGAKTMDVFFAGSQKPELLGAEIISEKYHSENTAWEYVITLDEDRFIELVYPTPITGKHFFSTFSQNSETFYQLAVYPPPVVETRVPRNILVLVDFNRFNTDNLDGELVLLLLKETMQQALTKADSAAIIVASDRLVLSRDHLLACNEQNLDIMFQPVLLRSFPGYSNFQVLLAAAADFIKQHKCSTEIVLITNTDEIDLYGKTRETFAAEIINMYPAHTPIHIIDLENKQGLSYNSEIGQYETQLAGFYGRLTNSSGGNLFYLRFHSIKNILAALFYENISHFQEVEVQTRFASGYAYGKHLIALHQGYYPLHFPIMQVGRFRGSLPLQVTVLGKVRLQKSSDDFIISENDVMAGDSQLAKAWYVDHIRSLLKETQTNPTIMEIMAISMAQRILTPYSGFLVFRDKQNQGYEPSTQTPETPGGNTSPEWDSGIDKNRTAVNRSNQDSSKNLLTVHAFPNPFNTSVQITISLTDVKKEEFKFAIYNSLGQALKSFSLKHVNGSRFTFLWDGRTDLGEAVSSGVYFAVLYGPNLRKTVKLVMLR